MVGVTVGDDAARWSDFYRRVYEEGDPTPDGPHGWLQWKGTDACIDLRCVCGYHGHVDADFFYYYRCKECGARYAVGAHVRLVPLSDADAEYAATQHAFEEDQTAEQPG